MTRKDLEKVYFLKRELKMWEKRLEELYADISQDSVAADGMPHSVTNKVSSPTESKAIQIADHIDLIRGKQAEIRMAIREVEAFIVGIDDPLIRQIVELRCACCMSWDEVADRIGNKNTAENVRQIYHRFLREVNLV
jgi:hypothetical protein